MARGTASATIFAILIRHAEKAKARGNLDGEPRAFSVAVPHLRVQPHSLYARDARRCPVLWSACGRVCEDTYRLYSCACCGVQVRICRHCDRGNTYCAGACATHRRRESLQRAGARYQSGYRGAARHAARQSAWRRRRAQKVTHQGSIAPTPAVIVTSRSMTTMTELTHAKFRSPEPPSSAGPGDKAPAALTLARSDTRSSIPRCSFCQRQLPPFARLGRMRR